ncbi:hypothetical protein J7394_20015 [Ruegeria sp. R13_0]|uniref:hypothetical protein n=1 Tax=Ruegeria sp. R13_0 TaxID=2821099 RepID=UPI001ADA3C8F|nr:hypothetical protein [Ruegeria sp. R13_0]MBO9436510.1 hypothetical protein [Ruegeria sp. R13_0]
MKKTFRIIRNTWLLLSPLLFAASLAFSVLIMAGGAVFNLASNAFEAITGKQSVASRHLTETKKLKADVAKQKQLNRKLRSDVSSLSSQLANKGASAQAMVTHKGKRTTAKAAVLATSASVTKRAAVAAGRSAGSVAGQSIPYVGTAVVVSVTALEIYDLCETIKDLNALSEAFDPTFQADENQNTVCSIEVPSTSEVWTEVKEAPRNALDTAKSSMPTLEELNSIEIPDIDWAGNYAWAETHIDRIYDNGRDGVIYLWDGTKDGADSLKEKLLAWWHGDKAVSAKNP